MFPLMRFKQIMTNLIQFFPIKSYILSVIGGFWYFYQKILWPNCQKLGSFTERMYNSAHRFITLVCEKGYGYRLYSSSFCQENLYAVKIFILLKLNWKRPLNLWTVIELIDKRDSKIPFQGYTWGRWWSPSLAVGAKTLHQQMRT